MFKTPCGNVAVLAVLCVLFLPSPALAAADGKKELPSVRCDLAADSGEISLIEDTDGTINQSVALDTTCLSKITCAFFKTHPENFDVIFAFTTYTLTMFGTPAGWAVKRTAKGIGYDVWADQSSKYCSKNGRLVHGRRQRRL